MSMYFNTINDAGYFRTWCVTHWKAFISSILSEVLQAQNACASPVNCQLTLFSSAINIDIAHFAAHQHLHLEVWHASSVVRTSRRSCPVARRAVSLQRCHDSHGRRPSLSSPASQASAHAPRSQSTDHTHTHAHTHTHTIINTDVRRQQPMYT